MHARPQKPAGGYSGTPLAKKIGVRPGHRLALVHRPDGWQIPDLPAGCESADAAGSADADVVVAFFRSFADLAAEAGGLARELANSALLWIAWPRRAAGHDSDLTDQVVRDELLRFGVVDVKVAALGEDWSGLKFVRRKENRRT